MLVYIYEASLGTHLYLVLKVSMFHIRGIHFLFCITVSTKKKLIKERKTIRYFFHLQIILHIYF